MFSVITLSKAIEKYFMLLDFVKSEDITEFNAKSVNLSSKIVEELENKGVIEKVKEVMETIKKNLSSANPKTAKVEN